MNDSAPRAPHTYGSSTHMRDHLPLDHLPVYGSQVTPESFTWLGADLGWTVDMLRRDGTPETLRLWLLPDGVAGSDHASGPTLAQAALYAWDPYEYPARTLTMPEHPYRKCATDVAPLEEWVAWIMLEDASGRRVSREGRWGGDDLDAVGRRLQLDIVAYEDFEIATSATDTFEGLRHQLEEALASTSLEVDIASIDEVWYNPSAKERPPLLRREEDGVATGYLPVAFTTDLDPQRWLLEDLVIEGSGYPPPSPFAHVGLSGSQILHSYAENVVAWTDLQDAGGRVVLEADARTPGLGDWIALRIRGTEITLICPREHAHIVIRVDGDGSRVTFEVHDAPGREAHHRRRDRFERRWGAWLDEDVVVSDAELRSGIASAEAALRGLLNHEAL